MDTAVIEKMKLLNVGGGSKDIEIPHMFQNPDEYEHILLDNHITREPPDIMMDASEISKQDWMHSLFDVIYCSHTLEHIPREKTGEVFRGFYHALKPNGMLLIRVPDLVQAINHMVENGREFHQQVQPESSNTLLSRVTYHDIIYGMDHLAKKNPYQRHVQAFTPGALAWGLEYVGFKHFFSKCEDLEILMLVFKEPPSEKWLKLFSYDE